MLEGLLELQELNMYGNKVAEIIVPHNHNLLSKLETLNLGYNDLAYLPDDLDQLKALRTLKVMNNFLEKVPMRVCDMDLRAIDVSSNPVIQPPTETCDRGICGMRRYYQCLRMEEQSKQKALEEVQKKLQRQKKKDPKKKSYGGFIKSLSLTKPSKPSLSTTRKTSDDNGSVQSVTSGSLRSVGGSIGSKDSSTIACSKDVRSSLDSESPPEDVSRKPLLQAGSWDEAGDTAASAMDALGHEAIQAADQVTVNDTLKVIFVGMAMVGKTSMIKRLIEG
jgi:hypothetical protein